MKLKCKFCKNELTYLEPQNMYHCRKCHAYFDKNLIPKIMPNKKYQNKLLKTSVYIIFPLAVIIWGVSIGCGWSSILLGLVPLYICFQLFLTPEERKHLNKINEIKQEKQDIPIVPNNNPTSRPTLINCSACGKQISNQASACPNCGQPTGVHVCPKCGSADTKVISGASKAVSVGLWGVFAANKVMAKYVCNKCSHKF